MECIVDKKALQNVLKKVQKCISTSTNILEISSSVLISVKYDRVIIKATNFNMYIKDEIDEVKIKEEGDVLIPFSLLNNLVRKYKNEKIHLRLNDSNLELVSKDNLFKVPILNIDFPEEYIVEKETELTIKESIIMDVFKRFIKIIPDESHQNSITGLNIKLKEDGTIDFVTTDTFRMYFSNLKDFHISGEREGQYLIPKNMVKYILGVLDGGEKEVKLILNNEYIKLLKDDLVLKHQLIAGSFPLYEKIIPKNLEFENKIKTSEFKDAINRVKIISDFMIGDKVITIKTEDDSLFVYSSDMKNLEKLNFDFKTPIDKNFDSGFLLDFINDTRSDDFKISFNKGNTAVVLNDRDINYMLMPIRK